MIAQASVLQSGGGSPRQSVRLSVLSEQTLMPDASSVSPSSNVPRRSKRQSRACGSFADAWLPDFTGPTTFFQSVEPDLTASSWTKSALREFVTVTVAVTAGFALCFGVCAACAVRPNRVAPASAAANVRVFIGLSSLVPSRGGLTFQREAIRGYQPIRVFRRSR